MPRQQRIKSKSGYYHIMLRGNERKNVFNDDDDKQQFLEELSAYFGNIRTLISVTSGQHN